jgi:sulfatase maturation enzyme AslB (radical SAM superfamily)
MKKPESLCLAPWTHTYLSPQTERRMCCASREPAQNFQQYIDTETGTGEYQPLTFAQHWNGEHMRSVRRRMLAGETLPECDVCNNKLLNSDVYRDYFWHLFKHKYEQVISATDKTGYTSVLPVSWDYRFSNLCNFKCRTCGDMLSSSWESEQRQHNMINWHDSKNNWMQPDVRKRITKFQDSQIESEFAAAVEEHRVEEIYWVGGEPLMYEQHWRYMQRIIDLGDGPKVYARYNTNLSRVEYRGTNLYRDILNHVRDWQICASIDGTGDIGEYIRTGLDYRQFRRNFEQGLTYQKNRRQMRLDFTLTLPGMFEVGNIQSLAAEYNVDLLTKVIFSFSPEIILSPLALPRNLLEPWIDELFNSSTVSSMRDLLMQLKSRHTFAEQWPEQHRQMLLQGKQRLLKLESIRPSPVNIQSILDRRPEVGKWFREIS